MEESEKYLIHADVTADGVVERSDVVGAIFGQTEGLLGAELDLRHLQERSKVGRIDVDVESEGGRSFGEVTIATSLDRVETAVLSAALETIDRVGPCRAELQVTAIEDVRAAKRREVVERAKELLADAFDESAASSQEILREVRRAVRVEDVTDFEGLPAGPNVGDSDAIIVVEGRADVLQLLQYGVKNAVAVEGTDVPDEISELTADRTVTAFLDGDRGGDLILRELEQVGDVDYVALAPPDRSVEDLSRREVMDALREKVPFDMVDDEGPGQAVPTDGGTVAASADQSAVPSEWPGPDDATGATTEAPVADPTGRPDAEGDDAAADDAARPDAGAEPPSARDADGEPGRATAADANDGDEAAPATEAAPDDEGDGDGASEPNTLGEHVEAVVAAGAGTVRLLDGDGVVLSEVPAGEAFDAVEGVEDPPTTVVLDGTATQRLLDVAAQRGVGRLVAREVGDVVKEPAGVRVLTAEQLLA